jgi:hypothetical protein
MGWKFSPSVVGRGIRAQKFVNGVVVKEFKICCINRLLIQIKAYEATLPGKRR